jgi:FtsH-binding integral membrane protein
MMEDQKITRSGFDSSTDETLLRQTIPAEQIQEIQRSFVLKVYGWMTAGLMLTGVFALLTLSSETAMQFVFSSPWTYIGLVAAELGLVIWLIARVQKLSAMAATLIFTGYAALTGVTLSVIFLAYTAGSIASTFFVSGATFGLTAAYGYATRRDLSGLGSFLTMGLIGVIIASVVNMFWQNDMLYWMVTYIGIFVFVGLTAYDMQKIKRMSVAALEGGEVEQKGAIIGALALYLDFINLFLLMLRLLGRRR